MRVAVLPAAAPLLTADAARLLPAGALWAAGMLKIASLATAAARGPGAAVDLSIAAAGVLGVGEILLGAWLLAWPRSRPPLWTAFWVMAGYTAWLLVGELRSPGWALTCDCFGPLRLTLWQHVAVNAVLIGAADTGLAALEGPRDGRAARTRNLVLVALGALAVAAGVRDLALG